MKTVAVVMKSLDEEIPLSKNSVGDGFLGSAKHVVMIFIEKNKMFLFNDPHLMLESEKTLRMEQKLHRKAVVEHLEKAAQAVKKLNFKAEVSKLVINGDEKYKIEKCLACLEVQAVMFIGRHKKKRFYECFVQSLEDYVFEAMKIPIIKIPASKHRS
ncbi:uncharacterized protein Eint_090610 [Encephalitozoon intestinalis ATCC 50506]|uniref:UspA domain-containing protein n=1 Tax=Encephalitozoon intestinalis (strain ATCC 50506) TaxID=876142 RepID=E0S9C6_ENCIT|nr:uncharacterized protein Eint_090610 [Encephalitozoon intestinalis ATCC 50506]ADM12190.2 hypothetical protein Eint_090610 [Encephalitozoon intestinalis ATCC 50506]UTX45997.1 hypothetical protein GPK93_09g15830 [Encephalitozoon intestinalis]